MSGNKVAIEADIYRTLRFFHQDGEVFEICAINPHVTQSALWSGGRVYGKDKIVAGWFDDIKAACEFIAKLDAMGCDGIYHTPNPCNDGLLSRAGNRLVANVSRTTNDDITRVLWLLIDVDPKRPSGISSTPMELECALKVTRTIKEYLSVEGFSLPADSLSGNGGHLAYAVNLPNNRETMELIKGTTAALDWKFGGDVGGGIKLEVDRKVFNAARLFKIYGTWARKGEDTPARPHRLSKILELPEARIEVSAEQIQAVMEKLAAEAPEYTPGQYSGKKRTQGRGWNGGKSREWDAGAQNKPMDVEGYLEHYGRAVVRVKDHGGSKLYVLKECVFDSSHSGGEAAVGVTSEGKLFYQCFHNSCSERTWAEAREIISGYDSLAQWIPDFKPAKRGPGRPPRQSEPNDEEKKPTQADLLIKIASSECSFFHDPSSEGYASFDAGGHIETWPLNSRGFKLRLRQRFFEEHGKAPNRNALSDAVGTLEAKCLFNGPEEPVFVRVAGDAGKIFLDLCNDKWAVIEIQGGGWSICTSETRPKFIRFPGMRPLPMPAGGASWGSLKQFVNLSDDDFKLVIGWLVQAFAPTGPYPILIAEGEQGSAKSTLCKLLRSIVDPSTVPIRSTPKEVRDLVISAGNAWVQAYDNLSGLPPWLSDEMCKISTGGGFSCRTNYSDKEETLFNATRPMLLNGIDAIATRHDLADRSIILNLPPIPDENRKTEKNFWNEWERVLPGILALVLDAVSMALMNREFVKLPKSPRMADFAHWVVAAEPALPWDEGGFLAVYSKNIKSAVEVSLDASPVGRVLREFMQDKEEWTCTATALLKSLRSHINEEQAKQKNWPKDGPRLSKQLRRLSSFLRKDGLEIDFDYRETGTQLRKLKIKKCKVRESTRHTRHTRQNGSEQASTVASTVASNELTGTFTRQKEADRETAVASKPPSVASNVRNEQIYSPQINKVNSDSYTPMASVASMASKIPTLHGNFEKTCASCINFSPNSMDPLHKPGTCPIGGADGKYTKLPGQHCDAFESPATATAERSSAQCHAQN